MTTTLQSILSSARSGMGASQALAALASRNLANVQTPGYAREALPLFAEIGGLAVRSGTPYANRQALLERALASTVGRFSFHDAQVGHLQLAEQAVNDLDDAGLGGALDDFREALALAAANPSGRSERQSVLTSAKALAGAFATTRSELEQGLRTTEDQVRAVAQSVNHLTTQIAQLNQKLRSARPGEQANSLLSQRAALVEQLSSHVAIDVLPRSDGTIQIASGGRTLVELESAATLVVSVDAGGEIGLSLAREGHESVPVDNVGGELGGLVEAHDGSLLGSIRDLDQLAFDFMDEFDAAHRSGFAQDGTGGFSFWNVPASVDGAARAMTLAVGVAGHPENVALARDPAGGPGDNTNVAALTQPLVRARTGFRDLGRNVSDALVSAQTGSALERGSVEQLSNMLASAHGVSIDEEMVTLSQAQSALEASSTVVREVQTMMDTVLSLVT